MARTLNSVLATLRKKNVFVKIGSVGGSGFWYCERLSPNSHEQIGNENLKLVLKEQKWLEKSKTKLRDLDAYYDNYIESWLKNPRNKKKSDAQKQVFISNQLALKESDKEHLPTIIKQLEYDLSIEFLNRPVVEIVDGISPDEPNTKVIYVKGYERGNYWTIKEYKKAHLPKEQQTNFNVRLPRLAEMESK